MSFKNSKFSPWVSPSYLCELCEFSFQGGRKQRILGKCELSNHMGSPDSLWSLPPPPHRACQVENTRGKNRHSSLWGSSSALTYKAAGSKHRSQAPPRGINQKSDFQVNSDMSRFKIQLSSPSSHRLEN